VPPVRLRASARAVILDEDDRILLCRFEFFRDGHRVAFWATPGGGVESGESLLAALHRELREEVGLELDGDPPPHIWHQEQIRPGLAGDYDGFVNDFFLVRVPAFEPRGSLSDAELAAEGVTGLRWWPLAELTAHAGPDRFGPRNMADLVAALVREGPPAAPLQLDA
jgi:ADP-ribose pyrophosphatase YjhB (NUDIX family)